MKYEIDIEGGFVGIPKSYKGEKILNPVEKRELFHSLKKVVPDKNERARDGFNYKLKLTDSNEVYKFEFDEFNIPKEVRMFIDSILETK